MNRLLIASVVFLASCGPDWGDCKTCRPGEDSAKANDGEQIPVVVNVNVTVDQNQSQGQQQNQNQSNANNNNSTSNNSTDAGAPDAGRDAGVKFDAGVKVDAGIPDAGVCCRRVCVCYETRYICKQTGLDTADRSKCACGVERVYNKCTREETRCN